MKKFNIFALIALSLAVVGNVGATSSAPAAPVGGAAFASAPLIPSQITNQRGALTFLKTASRPTALNNQSQALNASNALAVGASAAIDAGSSAKTNSLYDSTAFAEGSHIINSARSALSGGTSRIGEVSATNTRLTSSGLTGSNLKKIAGLSGLGLGSNQTSAMASISSGTKSKTNSRFINSSVPLPGLPSVANADGAGGVPGSYPTGTPAAGTSTAGTFGNVTNSLESSTMGSNTEVGRVAGGNHTDLQFFGNSGLNS